MLVTCPSGLSFNARKWKIGDRRNLHDQRIIRGGLLMRKMLEAADEGVEDPGPYDFEVGKPVPWANVSLTDIIDALIHIRIQTKPVLDYNEICENCGAKLPVSIDLRDLEITKMSADGKAHLSTGEPHVIDVPINGEETIAQVKIKMLRGIDMPILTKHYKQDPTTASEVQMVMHIVEITPPGQQTITQFRMIQKFFADQDWDFQTTLDEEIDKLGGGMRTQIDMECRRCNAEQQGTLPFGGEFFYPQRKGNTSSMATL